VRQEKEHKMGIEEVDMGIEGVNLYSSTPIIALLFLFTNCYLSVVPFEFRKSME
jgi:hypothetical protein